MTASDLVASYLPPRESTGRTVEDIIDRIVDDAPPCFEPDRGAIESALSELTRRGVAIADYGPTGTRFWREDS